ncbi:MAG: efflux RND transporter permease subunit, partial [Desulfobulbaceae bacterium]|nr:efflux RND transporter permease subunit [Desulfobulbaceae bacterium]
MDLIKYSISKPVSITVAVILLVTFGIIGLNKLPVQLTPDVEIPKITVSTVWSGATPYEIEQEIIEKQEEALKGLQGLTKMESASYNGQGEVTLSFKLGTDIDDALLRVSNKLNEVADYPQNVNKPAILSAGAQSSPIIWMLLKTKNENDRHINEYRTFFEDNIRQHIERVQGVGSLLVFGGTANELHVVIDSQKMARHHVTINQITEAIRKANRNISAGVLGMGKKNYRIRTVSQFQAPEQVLDVVIFDDGIKRVHLHDVADVAHGYKKENGSVIHNSTQGIVVGVRKEPGANVLELSDLLEKEIGKLNAGILNKNKLYLDWVYDQRPYINTAIDLVKQNVLIGGILAICVLLVFLRSVTSTLTTALAIPISAIGTFIFLWLLGRNLNVVSLAGISFAVGMLVDNSIVVLENIDRHRKKGKDAFHAAYDGAKEVWGAVLASTATTVAVFLPVIFMQEEAGQLFRDIAIAITCSILLSLFVSVSVIPTVIHQFYKRKKQQQPGKLQQGGVGVKLVSLIMSMSDFCLKSVVTRTITIAVLTTLSIGLTLWLKPPAEYLPQGNRNLILNILIPPPGYSVDKLKEMGNYIFDQTQPYFEEDNKDGFPQIKQIFYVGADRINLFGGLAVDDTRAREMMPLFNRIMNSIPGIFGISIQSGIFERGIGEGRNVDVNVSGQDINQIVDVSRTLYGMISQKIQGAQIRPIPSLETSYPEVSMVPNKEKLAANGLNEDDLGIYVDVLMDGRKIAEYRPDGVKQIDLVLTGDTQSFETPEDVLNGAIVNNHGDIIRVNDVADLVYGQGMAQINHLERDRTITLQVTPPKDFPLQTAMETIENDVLATLGAAGKLEGVRVKIG